MDFKKLNYILKIAETGNITKAAEELYMTQPALSHFISKTEREEGIQLFDRTSVPIRLTYAGERYVETIRKILELNEMLEAEISEINENVIGRLTIGIPPARAADLLPDILPQFMEKYPKVQISTVEHNSRQLRDDVRKQLVDFAVLPLLEGYEEFKHIDLFEEELFLVCRENGLSADGWHLNDKGEKVADIHKLKGHRFILLKHGHGIRDKIDFLFQLSGVRPEIVMETTNNETAYSLAAAGLGMAIVPHYNIRRLIPEHPVEVFKITDSGLKWTVAAILNPDVKAGVHALECIEFIRKKYGM